MIPTLLVPGLLSTAEIFAPQIPFLWRFGPVTVASTLAGATMAEKAAAILADAPPKFALAGMSMGGYVCFEILRQRPDRVLRLALIGTSARPDTAEQSTRRRASIERARELGMQSFAKEQLLASLHAPAQRNPRMRASARRMAADADVADYQRNVEATIARNDARGLLASITAPTMVLVGEHDALTPPSHARELADGIPDATLRTIARSGHATTIEQPRAVNAALRDWLTQHG